MVEILVYSRSQLPHALTQPGVRAPQTSLHQLALLCVCTLDEASFDSREDTFYGGGQNIENDARDKEANKTDQKVAEEEVAIDVRDIEGDEGIADD